jgi:hypothetical protein
VSLPGTVNLEVYSEDTFIRTITIKENDSPKDVSNWTFDAHIREDLDSSTIVEEFTIKKTQPADGEIEIELTSNQTNALETGKNYVYDVQVEQDSGVIKTLFGGKLAVRPDVTTIGA